ncbi:TetR/AcrR family transcriptional regulator [Actinoplanes sp. CA-142083]|uniref:TetR/AcrR family transcriptional regulator n=1 Tax=Actinoplanes sp. CA-142083 TaxID=3239903 RepID=UPI003D8CD6DE
MAKQTYHHGDLRRALLQAADEAITEHGVAALSMRDLARRAGVSHAAPTHHFGDKAGLLTAFATEGFEQLAKALATSRLASNSFLELGVTYVRFAVTRRAMFEVMFRPDLYHPDDPELLAARAKSADALYAAVSDLPDSIRPAGDAAPAARPAKPGTAETAPPEVRKAGLAAWSMAHGFATLWLTGGFPDRDLDPTETARRLFTELNRDYAP